MASLVHLEVIELKAPFEICIQKCRSPLTFKNFVVTLVFENLGSVSFFNNRMGTEFVGVSGVGSQVYVLNIGVLEVNPKSKLDSIAQANLIVDLK